MLISWALPATESLLRCHAHVTCHMTTWQHDTVMTAAATRSQRRAPPVREAGRRLLSARHGGYTDTRTRGDRAFVTRDPRTGHQWRWRPLRVQADLTNTGRVFPESYSGNKCWSRAVARCCGALLWNKRNDGEVKSICWIFRKMRLRKKFCGSASTGTGVIASAVSTFGHISYLTLVWSYLSNIHMM